MHRWIQRVIARTGQFLFPQWIFERIRRPTRPCNETGRTDVRTPLIQEDVYALINYNAIQARARSAAALAEYTQHALALNDTPSDTAEREKAYNACMLAALKTVENARYAERLQANLNLYAQGHRWKIPISPPEIAPVQAIITVHPESKGNAE